MTTQNLHRRETQYLKAKIAYYDGEPIMSDPAFDVLERELKADGSKVVEQVGSKRSDFDFPHPTLMMSLDKLQTESVGGTTDYQEIPFWGWLSKRRARLVDGLGRDVDSMEYTPKFDGSGINMVYRGPSLKLESVLTRGDGGFGKDVTDRFYGHLPKALFNDMVDYRVAPRNSDVVEIRCEAVITFEKFEAINEACKARGEAPFANPRNLVAGIIRRDDIDPKLVADIKLMPIHVIADGVHQDINSIKNLLYDYPIFSEPYSTTTGIGRQEYLDAVKSMEKLREKFPYPLDGVVFSLPCDVRGYLGENGHDPEWAIAVKFVPDEVATPVIGVEWNLGKTGELAPVVLLKPVQLAGTTVGRASGYNAGYVVDNMISEGAIVSIAKAGEIIPEIQEICVPGEKPVLPESCPSCGSTLTFDGIHLCCPNAGCQGRIAKKLASEASMLDLRGIGDRTIEPFAAEFGNIYQIMEWVLRESGEPDFSLELFGIRDGTRSAEIFVDAFKNIRSLKYSQVILMMGYDGVGSKIAEQAAKEYCGMEPNYASMEHALVELLQREDVKSHVKAAVRSLELLGVTIDKPKISFFLKNDGMNVIHVCMTGSPKLFGYKTKEEFVSQFSDVSEVSVTDPKCGYLITDSPFSTSSKMQTAKKKGIKIVTYGGFVEERIGNTK